MRKVTASAVLLTAITGCAQSKAPTNQWSFEVPDFSETAASFNSVNDNFTLPSALSDEAQAFVNQASKAQTDPAFEPKSFRQLGPSNPDALIVTSLPTAPASDADVSPPVTVTTALVNELIQTYTAPRPDPVAEARAYLNNNSPELATNGGLYSSAQAYLPSFTAATPISDSTPVMPSTVAAQTANPAVESINTANALPSLLPQAQTITSQADLLSPNSLSPVASTSIASTSIASTSIREVAATEDVPLGTAILLSMQQNSAENSATAVPNVALSSVGRDGPTSVRSDASFVVDPLPTLTPAAIPVLQPAIELPNQSSDLVATVPSNALADTGFSTLSNGMSSNSTASGALPSNASLTEPVAPSMGLSAELQPTIASLMPEQTAITSPTLKNLTQSMPYREPSRLVIQFQTSADNFIQSGFTRSDSTQTDFAQAKTLFNPQPEDLVPLVTIQDLAPIRDVETDASSSPLLEGLQSLGASSESTVYLPVTESATGTSIDSLASSMQVSISTLSDEASTSTFNLLNLAGVDTASAEEISLENPPSIARSIAAQITETSRAISLRSDTAKRFNQATQRAIPTLDLGRKLSSKYRHRAFWH